MHFRNLILMLVTTSLCSCVWSDPYRQREIQTLDTGIVLETNEISGKQVLDENPELKQSVEYDAILMVFKSLNFSYVSSVEGELDGTTKALLKTLDGKTLLIYHPDPNLKPGDCLDFLRVDGREMIAYANECDPRLQSHNKSLQPTANSGG